MDTVYGKALEMLKDILGQIFVTGEVEMVLFGSRARGDYLKTSDIDLGILPQGELDERKLILLREKLENSNIPYKVDVVDFSKVSKEFAEKALEEGVVIWRG